MRNIFAGLLLVVVLIQCDKKTTEQDSATLENTVWGLIEFNGKPLIGRSDSTLVYITLKSENGEKQLSGFARCNKIGGSYTVDGDAVKFNAISTRMMCQDNMDIENFLLYALTNAEKYVITDTFLELYKGEMMLARFEEVNPLL